MGLSYEFLVTSEVHLIAPHTLHHTRLHSRQAAGMPEMVAAVNLITNIYNLYNLGKTFICVGK